MTLMTEDIISTEIAGTLDGLMYERIQRTPETTAYRSYDAATKTWRDTSWEEVGREISRWQAALQAEELLPGERVAVHLRNSKEWVYFDQAALSCGLVIVPLYTDDRPDNIAYILENSTVKVLLVQDAQVWKRLAPALAGQESLRRVLILNSENHTTAADVLKDKRVRFVDDWLPAEAGPMLRRDGDPHALASIVYTSGTTGRPKGVMLSHYNMLSIAHSALTMVEVYVEDLFLSFLPLSHTLERTGGYYLPVMSGSAVAYARSIAQLGDDLQKIRPTVLIAVPRIFEKVFARIQSQMSKESRLKRTLFEFTTNIGWNRFQRQQKSASWHPRLLAWPLMKKLVADKVTMKLGGRLRMAVSGGAPLSLSVAKTFIGLGVPILQGYGLTETSPVISVNLPEDNMPASVGVPLNGVEVRVGKDDELLVKTPGMMKGYWNNHVATAEIIDSQGWLHTGDQARIDSGHIFITGRIKDILVMSNGEKVPPMDMELAICLSTNVDQALVIGEGQSFLAAILVLNPDEWPGLAKRHGLDTDDSTSLQDRDLNAHLIREIRGNLKDFPGYAKIRRLVLTLDPWTIDNGLLTPTLKIKRDRVLNTFTREIASIYDSSAQG